MIDRPKAMELNDIGRILDKNWTKLDFVNQDLATEPKREKKMELME